MATWTIDPMHSEVQFKVKHLVISTVTGSFKEYSASIEANNDDFSDAKVNFEASINSIDTGNEQRDGHLKADDFFNAEAFPILKFVSTGISKNGDKLKLNGHLTIRDITKEVSFDAEFGGTMTDFYGNLKAGFEVSGKINRKDFGLSWDAVTEAGGVVVSDEVKLIANVQFAKQA